MGLWIVGWASSAAIGARSGYDKEMTELERAYPDGEVDRAGDIQLKNETGRIRQLKKLKNDVEM